MGRFDGTVAWITGGASGLGRASALRFARDGARVAVSDIDEEGLAGTVKEVDSGGGEAIAVPCDVTNLGQCDAAVATIEERLGRLDHVFANAGIVMVGAVTWVPEEEFLRVLDVNLNGVFRTAKAAMPALQRAGGGSIVLTSSVEGIIGNAILPAYCSSKAAVIGLARALAHEGGAHGIRVNCVNPGFVDTPMTAPLRDLPGVVEDFVTKIPLGRIGTADDVAGVVAFLCSDDARYVTGTAVPVDGGYTAVR